mmetsp:Transcript_35255/g.89042  ORF Transcript_35255/g.89042 Transcript_35255/m.89042 type:complete len:641 (+) Transcript_35255:2-1924(+)
MDQGVFVDSACSTTLYGRGKNVSNVTPLDCPRSVQGIAGEVAITHKCDVTLCVLDSMGMPHEIFIKDAFYHPLSSVNLISVNDLNQSGYDVRFDRGNPHLTTNNNVNIPMRKTSKLFNLVTYPTSGRRSNATLAFAPEETAMLSHAELWHLRFHASHDKIKRMLEHFDDVPNVTSHDKPDHRCVFCDEARLKKRNRPKGSEHDYKTDADAWSVDQFEIGRDCLSLQGNHYVYIFVLLHSRFIIVEFTPDHTEASFLKCFKSAISKAGHTPQKLRSDHGGEFESPGMNAFCADREVPIKREFSNAWEQYQDGVSESAVHRLTGLMRLLLIQAGSPPEHWALAARHAADILNHTPHRKINNEIPIIRHGERAFLNSFRAFGCQATVHMIKDRLENSKLSPRGLIGVYVGTAETDGQKGFRIYLPEKNTIVVASDVVFDETFLPLLIHNQRYNPHVSDRFVTPETPMVTPGTLLEHVCTPEANVNATVGTAGEKPEKPPAGQPATAGESATAGETERSPNSPISGSAGEKGTPQKESKKPSRQVRMDWQVPGPQHMNNVSDVQLAEFLIGEEIIFNVYGDQFHESPDLIYKAQIFDTKVKRKKYLYCNVCFKIGGQDNFTAWMPVSTDPNHKALTVQKALEIS